MTVDDFKDVLYWAWRKRMSQMECRRESFWVPQENRFGENWDWEDSEQCYELDTKFQNKEYFEQMDGDEQIKVFRKMENFMMERGITQCFMRNYLTLDQVMREEEERNNRKEIDDDYIFN